MNKIYRMGKQVCTGKNLAVVLDKQSILSILLILS